LENLIVGLWWEAGGVKGAEERVVGRADHTSPAVTATLIVGLGRLGGCG